MRIASLAPSATLQVQELGMEEALVACTHVCPLPPAVRRTLAVGTFSVLDEAKLIVAKPDLVITATLVQAGGAKRLAAAGFDVLHLDPKNLSDIAASYELVGEAVERKELGQHLRKSFSDELEAVSAPSAREQRPPTLYMEEWHEPPFVSGNWVPDMVRVAGGTSVLRVVGEPSREVTFQELVESDPDYIVQHVCLPPLWSFSSEAQLQQRERHRLKLFEQLKARPGWMELRAVREGRVFSADDQFFNMPTRVVLRGIRRLREIVEEVEVRSV